MDTKRWQEVKKILDAAVSLPPVERLAFVARNCGDETVRKEISSLLAFHVAEDEAIDCPIFDVNAEDPSVGQHLGRYRIVRTLGRGGMGKVYLATREDDYEKQVAIKLIQNGIDTEDRVTRFHEERQILADLEHPSIARLLDGGTTEDGLPYLVMEYIEGEPIDRYCDTRKLDLRGRLELFSQVLAAVRFSHEHLVVHCDLKPGNILVTEDGTPKLIDFGIAKLLRPTENDGVSPARRERALSPHYASPEQLRGGRITTASDIYALGVLLYQLLAGHHPYSSEISAEEDLERVVCETTPNPPSAAFRGSPDEAQASARKVAAAQGARPHRLRRQLAGEIDAIVMKAIVKEPGRRYNSAAQFDDDIRRYLRGFPIEAYASTWLYRARKWVKRHPATFLASWMALVAFVLVATTLALRSRVEQERRQNREVAAFVEGLFQGADPDVTLGEELTVRELLERGRDDLGTGLEELPLARAALLTVVGQVHRRLSLLEEAQDLLTEALELQQRHDPDDPDAVAGILNDLAAVFHDRERLDAAEMLYREALEVIGGCRSEREYTYSIASNLADLHSQREDFAEAETLLDCLGEQDDSQQEASRLNKFGALRYRQSQLDEAETLFREVIRRRRDGPSPTGLANALNNLGWVLVDRGRNSEARLVLQEALDIRREILGEVHPRTRNLEENLERLPAGEGEPTTPRPSVLPP